ncbi:MAG: hypothetical protein ACTSVC_16055, partial [Promethearchaeota archaeon]
IKELKWVDLKEDPLNQEDTPEYTLTKDEDEKSKWIRDLGIETNILKVKIKPFQILTFKLVSSIKF